VSSCRRSGDAGAPTRAAHAENASAAIRIPRSVSATSEPSPSLRRKILRYLYTWGWLDLASSIPTIDVARWGRVSRAARIFRVLRGVRATKVLLGSLALTKRAESAFLAVALVAILLLVVASISILQVETAAQSNIKTADDALWWALSTITTVGYGDRYRVTPEGRFVAGVLMCAGVGLFGMFSGLLAAWFVAPAANQERSELESAKRERPRRPPAPAFSDRTLGSRDRGYALVASFLTG
jgi:voltage-gated potassium channel Kch